MIFKRELQSEETVELSRTENIPLKVTFKQYDKLTSSLSIKTTFRGNPTIFTNEKVYMTYMVQQTPYSGLIEVTKNGSLVRDIGTYSQYDKGLITVNIDPEVLKYSGEVKCELVITSNDGTERFTSPTMSFKIEPSLFEETT